MNDKEYKVQKERIRKLIKKWVKSLGLNWYEITFEYERGIRTDTTPTAYSPKVVKGVWETVMETEVDPYYGRAVIVCYLGVIKNLEDQDLEETFLHECMHIFLSPMHNKKENKQEELVATRLAKAFIWSHNE